MELTTLFKALVLYLSTGKNEIIPWFDEPAVEFPPLRINDKKNCSNELSPSLALVPYDCAMPYPPIIKNNEPEPEEHSELPTIIAQIHVVHKLPDSAVIELHRFENYCEEKIHDVYSAIKDFNNYNYEKNQEIQYLVYNEKQKQEIIEQSQSKKSLIETRYNKMHQICARCERNREKITLALNPYMTKSPAFFTQPKRVPKLWYDMHNLETVVQQIFTPKLRMRTHFDNETKQIRMHRVFVTDMTRKQFIALPKEYRNDEIRNNDSTVDGASVIVEDNNPHTDIEVRTKRISTIEQFNNNILEQFTYSSKKDIQQIIIYYVFKYYEHEVQEGTRKVFHYSQMLKKKKRSAGIKQEITNLEGRLADALVQLQDNTIEMERNRVIRELVGVYNAENEAHDLLQNTEFITKLIGSENKRVVTAFNPSESINFNALDGSNMNLIADINQNDVDIVHARDRENLDEPLYWDQNWTWDY